MVLGIQATQQRIDSNVNDHTQYTVISWVWQYTLATPNRVGQKRGPKLIATILSNLNRFSIFFTGRYFLKVNLHFVCLATTLLEDEERALDNHVPACNFAKYSPILNNFSQTDLTTPLHPVATLSSNLSLMTCFADINVSQGSVATYASSGAIFNNKGNLFRYLCCGNLSE